MAESTSALKFDDLMAIVSERIGSGYRANQAAGLSADEETEIELYVAEGYAEFLLAYEWSFLKPTATSVLWATATGTLSSSALLGASTTGAPTYDSDTLKSTVIADAAIFHANLIGKTLNFTVGGAFTITDVDSTTQLKVSGDASSEGAEAFTITEVYKLTASAAAFYASMERVSFTFDAGSAYTILSYVSTTVVYVSGDASGESGTDTFTVTADGSYPLPDDFGGLLGDVFFQADEGRWIPLANTGVAELLELLQVSTATGRPTICAVDPQTVPAAASDATGQRSNLLAWRIADADYTVRYQYQVLAPRLVANGYPYGGAGHAETLKYFCLAAMERSKFQLAEGPLWRQSQRLLALSIRADQRGTRARTLGFLVSARPRHRRRGSYGPQAGTVTVGGVAYP